LTDIEFAGGRDMSCYFRHLEPLFDEAGIKVTPANRKQVDQLVHKIVDVEYKNCPATWKQIKLGIADPQKKQEFIQKLKNAFPA
jgi:hypothetical protein